MYVNLKFIFFHEIFSRQTRTRHLICFVQPQIPKNGAHYKRKKIIFDFI